MLTIVVAPAALSAPSITSSTYASGTAGSPFSYTITASNSPTNYSATGLPSGLVVNATTGLISGTPTNAGTSQVTIGATNSAGPGTAVLTITVVNSIRPHVSWGAKSVTASPGQALAVTMAAFNDGTADWITPTDAYEVWVSWDNGRAYNSNYGYFVSNGNPLGNAAPGQSTTPSFIVTAPISDGIYTIRLHPYLNGSLTLVPNDAIVSLAVNEAQSGTIYTFTTFAGAAGQIGFGDGPGNTARLEFPLGVAANAAGMLYVTNLPATIRQVTADGIVTTLAGTAGVQGSADGIGGAAQFNFPYGVVVDAAGNIYVADWGNNVIRKISASGVVTTIAGTAAISGNANGTGSAAQFNGPCGIGVDNAGNVYVADSNNCTIRKIGPGGVVTTLAGTAGVQGSADGIGSAATFNNPSGIAVDDTGNVYVADTNNHSIRKITAGGVVTTLAGTAGVQGSADGTGSAARFYEPYGVAVDRAGTVYVADSGNDIVRRVTARGVVTTLAGTAGVQGNADGIGGAAQFGAPFSVAVDGAGILYVADTYNHTIRKGVPVSPVIMTPPQSQAATVGASVTFSAAASGTPNPTYQWYFNGNPIFGATNSSYAIASVQPSNSGSYIVVATSGVASTASLPAMLTVTAASGQPAIAAQPVSQTIVLGSTVVFNVSPSGVAQSSSDSPDILRTESLQTRSASGAATTYQWYFNGNIITGATSSTLVVEATVDSAGAYSCLLKNTLGSVLSSTAILSITATNNPGRLINLSVNAVVNASGLIMGFVTGGAGTTGSQSLMIRAGGPVLTLYGVTGVLPDPQLTVFNGQTPIATNAGWGSPAINLTAVNLAQANTGAGMVYTNPASLDAATVLSLAANPGYTVLVSGKSSDSGRTLAEVYDDTTVNTYTPTTPRLVNVSCRISVGVSSSLTEGFYIGGTTAKTVLIRAIGPGLTALGVSGVMPDPQLTVYSGQTAIASNVGWGGNSQLTSIMTAVGALPTPPATGDSTIVITLAPGGYTAVATSASGTAGNVLVDIFEVP